MLGSLRLPLFFGRHYEVFGGPYSQIPSTHAGVKLAREISRPCEVSIPIVDYSIPAVRDLDAGLRKAVALIIDGHPVYAGCMGGMGRTGLFLAVLAKAFGVHDPIIYVRDNYYHHAVETDEQYAFVTNYEVPEDVLRRIRIAKWWAMFSFTSNMTRSKYI